MLSAASLRAVSDDEIPTFGEVPDTDREARAMELERKASDAVFLALKALSQRAIVAFASLVDLLLISSAFALCVMVIPSPTVLQLVGVGGYGLFILAATWMRTRRRTA